MVPFVGVNTEIQAEEVPSLTQTMAVSSRVPIKANLIGDISIKQIIETEVEAVKPLPKPLPFQNSDHLHLSIHI